MQFLKCGECYAEMVLLLSRRPTKPCQNHMRERVPRFSSVLSAKKTEVMCRHTACGERVEFKVEGGGQHHQQQTAVFAFHGTEVDKNANTACNLRRRTGLA